MRSCPAEITPHADVTDAHGGGCIKPPDALRDMACFKRAPLATTYFCPGTALGTIARVKVRGS